MLSTLERDTKSGNEATALRIYPWHMVFVDQSATFVLRNESNTTL